jgi:hypothetical protein
MMVVAHPGADRFAADLLDCRRPLAIVAAGQDDTASAFASASAAS